MKHRFSHILFFVLFAGALYAAPHFTRNYAYRYFTSRDGMAQMQVKCAFQDRDGYIWFGTASGISRFDGQVFKNYTAKTGFPSEEVVAISQLDDDILMMYPAYVLVLHPDETFTTIGYPEGYGIMFSNQFMLPFPQKNKMLIFNLNKLGADTDNNFHHFEYDNSNQTIKKYPFLSNEKVLAANGELIVGTNYISRQRKDSLEKLVYIPKLFAGAFVDWDNNIFNFYEQATNRIYKYSFEKNLLRLISTIKTASTLWDIGMLDYTQ